MATKAQKPPRKKAGRKSDYREEYADLARKYCLLGATDFQLGEFFSVSEQTINSWKKKYPEFLESVKKGKAIADAEVIDSLYQRATGFEWDEAVPMKIKEVKYNNGKREREWEKIEVTMVHKVVPPDTTAIIYWLNNRQKDNWRNRHEVDHTNKGEKFSTPHVYLPQDLPREAVEGEK